VSVADEIPRLVIHEPACDGMCGDAFECEECGEMYGPCKGAADDRPEVCDYCWVQLDEEDQPA
jgi:hypothetical protein